MGPRLATSYQELKTQFDIAEQYYQRQQASASAPQRRQSHNQAQIEQARSLSISGPSGKDIVAEDGPLREQERLEELSEIQIEVAASPAMSNLSRRGSLATTAAAVGGKREREGSIQSMEGGREVKKGRLSLGTDPAHPTGSPILGTRRTLPPEGMGSPALANYSMRNSSTVPPSPFSTSSQLVASPTQMQPTQRLPPPPLTPVELQRQQHQQQQAYMRQKQASASQQQSVTTQQAIASQRLEQEISAAAGGVARAQAQASFQREARTAAEQFTALQQLIYSPQFLTYPLETQGNIKVRAQQLAHFLQTEALTTNGGGGGGQHHPLVRSNSPSLLNQVGVGGTINPVVANSYGGGGGGGHAQSPQLGARPLRVASGGFSELSAGDGVSSPALTTTGINSSSSSFFREQ